MKDKPEFASKAEERRYNRAIDSKLAVKNYCSICAVELDPNVWDHNAQPINDGRCCSNCNDRVVLPARIMRLRQGRGVY